MNVLLMSYSDVGATSFLCPVKKDAWKTFSVPKARRHLNVTSAGLEGIFSQLIEPSPSLNVRGRLAEWDDI